MKRTALLLVCFTCVLFTSCKPVIGTVTDEEALAAGKRLEAIVKSGDSKAVTLFLDMPAMYEIFKKKSRNAEAMKKEFADPLSLELFFRQYTDIAKNGSFMLLRSYNKNGRQHILFRSFMDGAINYQDFQLIKVNNKVKADDMLNYMTGEEISSTFATTADALMNVNKKERYADTIIMIRKLYGEGQYYHLKEIYDRLPLSLQQARGIMSMNLQACSYISGEAFSVALNKAIALYPDSPVAYLCMMAAATQSKDYDKALFAINKIDEITGGDPYLDHYRAGLYWMMKKPAETIALLEKVNAYDPGFVINNRALLRAYTSVNEIDKAKKVIAAYKASKNFSQRDMDTFVQEFPQLFH